MMNMQDLFHDFSSLVTVRNIDLKPFMILLKKQQKKNKIISIGPKIDNSSIFYVISKRLTSHRAFSAIAITTMTIYPIIVNIHLKTLIRLKF